MRRYVPALPAIVAGIEPYALTPRLLPTEGRVRMETEHRLSSVLTEFAHNLVTGYSIQEILDHLVVRIVSILPVTGAGSP
jgi:hypothetical protein